MMGCNQPKKHQSFVVLADNKKEHNAVIVSNNKGNQRLNKVREFVKLEDSNTTMEEPEIMSKKEFDKRFNGVIQAFPNEPLIFKLYLKKSHVELTSASQKILIKVVEEILKNTPCIIDISGYSNMGISKTENLEVSLQEAKSLQYIIQEKILELNPHKKDITLTTIGYGDLISNKSKNYRYVEVFIK